MLLDFVKVGVVALITFSSALAEEKVAPETQYVGRITALYQDEEKGKIHILGETFRLLVDKDGTLWPVPLDLGEHFDLAQVLWQYRNREITLVGTTIEKEWPFVFNLPVANIMVAVPVEQKVLRVREVRIDFEKEPVVKPKGDD